MKLLNTPNLPLNGKTLTPNNDKNQSQVSFTGGEVFTAFLNFLQTNQGFGATAVDFCCMSTPRTVIDFTRSPEAGTETARREYTSTINDAALGLYGIGAAYLLSRGLNSKYNVSANKMFVDDETLNIYSAIRNEKGDINKPENLKNYLNEIFDNARAFNPNAEGKCDTKGWVKIDNKKDLADKFFEELKKPSEDTKEAKENLKIFKKRMRVLLINSTGVEDQFKLEKEIINSKTKGKIVQTSVCSAEAFVDNIYKVSKAFMSKNVVDAFKTKDISTNSFIKAIKGLNAKTAILGVAACSLVGAATQPINMYLTKKKTGKTGFVGGGSQDNSTGFKILKAGAAAALGLGMLRTIGKFSSIISKIQFKGIVPTIPQFKLAYGITIVSRLLSARNGNELRESGIKDSLGFANWLILGGFVSKLAAAGFENLKDFKKNNIKFLKYNEKENGKGLFKLLINSSIVTREEVLHQALQKANISTIENGKVMKFKEMLKAAKDLPGVKSKLRYLAFIQFAGYLWSGLALGVAIPKLNIAITNSVEKKKLNSR